MDQKLTAALLIIGNEILSGRTQDANAAFIGKRLAERGIEFREIRVVRDDKAAIVAALNALRAQYTYVFTTGGIGPTHDDITAECVAAAFGVALEVHPEAYRRLNEYYKKQGSVLNDARMRMTRVPAGGTLVDNPVSIAPGFKIDNVFVMAGVPKIMQAMFDHVETMLGSGTPVQSRTVACNLREGDIAAALEAIQNQFPDIDIGSYPQMWQNPTLKLVARGIDETKLDQVTEMIAEMVRKMGDTPVLA